MVERTPDFTLDVEGVAGLCPAGETYAKQMMTEGRIPVYSCEGPCIRGEIARVAANFVADEVPSLARACHAETFFVPHSAMARWAKTAEKAVMIDGCFLQCHGRVLRELIGDAKVVQFDAHSFHRKYNDVFRIDGVPEEERKVIARQVADKILTTLKQESRVAQPV